MVMRDMQVQLDFYNIYTRPVGSVRSLKCLCDTCRLSWISSVYTRPVAQLDLYSFYGRHVCSVRSLVFMRYLQAQLDLQSLYKTCRLSWIYIVFIRDLCAQLDPQCLCETSMLSWICIVFMRDLQTQLDLYSVYTRPIGSVGYIQCLYKTCCSVGSL